MVEAEPVWRGRPCPMPLPLALLSSRLVLSLCALCFRPLSSAAAPCAPAFIVASSL